MKNSKKTISTAFANQSKKFIKPIIEFKKIQNSIYMGKEKLKLSIQNRYIK